MNEASRTSKTYGRTSYKGSSCIGACFDDGQACCALALLRAFIEVSSKQDHFEDFLCDGSCRLGSFIRALLGGAPCGPMHITWAFLTWLTQYMDVTSLLAQNMESFSRKLVYRFIKSAAISNNFLYGRRVCSNKQPFLSIVGPAYSRGEILFLGYKWRFFTSFLHSTLILYLIFYPPTLVIWI